MQTITFFGLEKNMIKLNLMDCSYLYLLGEISYDHECMTNVIKHI